MEVLKTENLTRLYCCSGENQIRALYRVNINIQDGEFIAIVGSSGSGWFIKDQCQKVSPDNSGSDT